MKNIQMDIKKKEFKNVYLISGNEEYLKSNCKKRLKEAIIEDDSMNYNHYEGKGINTKELIDISETMPFFAEKRLIILENTGFFKSSQEDITDYVEEVPESTILVFVEQDVDKRNRLYKKVKAKGYACDISTPSEKELETWVLGFIGKEHKKITRETLSLFLHTVGDDMVTISQEIEKLFCYTMDREVITNEDVAKICTKQIDVKIFDLFTAMTEGNQEKTLGIYYELIESKEPLMRILFMLVRQFNQLLMVKDLTNRGYGKKEIASKMSLRSDWIVSQLQRQSKGYTISKLKEALKDCARNEEAVKTGNLDERTAVEMILVRYSKKVSLRGEA